MLILEEMLNCNYACSAGDFKAKKFIYEEDMIDWLYHNLPTISYVVDQLVNYIFSNGLTTGDEKQDEQLNEFLYAENIKGTTNYNVLREAVKNSLVYGKSGIRYLNEDAGLINVNSKNYACLTEENEEFYGFDNIVGYILSTDNQKIWETDLDEIEFNQEAFVKKGIVVDTEREIVIVSKEDFINLRQNTTKDNGESPLAYDLQRLQLLMTVYQRLNYDVEYDGPGRLLFKLKENYANGSDNDLGTDEVLNQTKKAKDSRVSQVKKEVKEMGDKIKNSSSDSVIGVSDIFEDFEHLPKTTKATEFFEWLGDEGVIISQIFGISPTLIGLGKVSGNVSMEKIIDNAMLNVIIPKREEIAIQISSVLAEKIGVDKIYFDKYEMKQVVDDNDKRLKIVNMIEKLKRVGYDQLADKLAGGLEEDLDASGFSIKKLKVKALDKLRKLFNRSGENYE